MSGHSKWASIKHKKAATDAKRGKIFTKHAKLVEIAAREGSGGNPDSNPRLRTAIDDAKADNVPNINIERAIKKGTGELKGAAQTVDITYEAFGPAGTAYIIECLTDNRNRAIQSVKATVNRAEGRLAQSGAVSWMFERKGVVVARGEVAEELELVLIDAGAEDIGTTGDTITVTTSKDHWPKVRDALRQAGCTVLEAGLKYVPKETVDITDGATAQRILRFMNALEDDEDVSEVHTNADISEEVAKELQSS
jgi:YebC/PmpR family DNA-binding regulatory protein